jgi:hypothetical protein
MAIPEASRLLLQGPGTVEEGGAEEAKQEK